MKTTDKKRFSPERRVLVGMGMRPGTVKSVADVPSILGEFVHEVLMDENQETLRVLGCEIYPIPDLDADLPRVNPPAVSQNIHVHGENPRVNLNSTDNSVNTTIKPSDQMFVRIREEVRSIPNES